MGLFSSSSKSKSTSLSQVNPAEVTSPFGSVGGGYGELNINPNEQLMGNYGLFGDLTRSAGEQYQAFDTTGFENAVLERLREMSRYDEEMQSSNLISDLFGSGKLGRSIYDESGNLIQPELFNMQKALSNADLMRQIQAITEARNTRNDLLNAAITGTNIQGSLFQQPLSLANLALQGATTLNNTKSKSSSGGGLGSALLSGALSAFNPISAIGTLGSGLGQSIAGSGGLFSGIQNYLAAPVAQAGGGLYGTAGSWAGPRPTY